MALNIINPTPPLDGQVLLSYGPLDLQIVRTEEWLCEPETDWSGVDYCLNHIVLGVKAIVNPFATGTSTGVPIAPGSRDRAGVTMDNLQQILMTPRQRLTFRIGPDIVVQAPLVGQVRDAKNGPKPLACRIIEVKGTKTAIIYFRIETWIGGHGLRGTSEALLSAQNVVLSNRWSATAHVDEAWLTTITTHGRMKLRTDGLDAMVGAIAAPFTPPSSPDIFRESVLPLPVPDGFRRETVDVVAKEDGTELMWTCVDRQKVLNLVSGALQGTLKVEGHYTTGSEVGYKDMKDVTKLILGASTAVTQEINLAAAGGFLMALLPSVRSSFYVKVSGQPPQQGGPFGGNIRQQLLNVAAQVALDRFAPSLPAGNFNNLNGGNIVPGVGGPVSLYATVSIERAEVELRGEVLGSINQILDPVNFKIRMNMRDDMTGAGAGQAMPKNTLDYRGATGANPNPPNSNTSKGFYVGTLLEQVLKGAFSAPASNGPSEDPTSYDFAFR